MQLRDMIGGPPNVPAGASSSFLCFPFRPHPFVYVATSTGPFPRPGVRPAFIGSYPQGITPDGCVFIAPTSIFFAVGSLDT